MSSAHEYLLLAFVPQVNVERCHPFLIRIDLACHLAAGDDWLGLKMRDASVVRGLTVENCKVLSDMSVINFKLRSDTPQTYEDVHFRGLTLQGTGRSKSTIAHRQARQGRAAEGTVKRLFMGPIHRDSRRNSTPRAARLP